MRNWSLILAVLVSVAGLANPQTATFNVGLVVRGEGAEVLGSELIGVFEEQLNENGLTVASPLVAPGSTLADLRQAAGASALDAQIIVTVESATDRSIAISVRAIPSWEEVFGGVASAPAAVGLSRGMSLLVRRSVAALSQFRETQALAELSRESAAAPDTDPVVADSGPDASQPEPEPAEEDSDDGGATTDLEAAEIAGGSTADDTGTGSTGPDDPDPVVEPAEIASTSETNGEIADSRTAADGTDLGPGDQDTTADAASAGQADNDSPADRVVTEPVADTVVANDGEVDQPELEIHAEPAEIAAVPDTEPEPAQQLEVPLIPPESNERRGVPGSVSLVISESVGVNLTDLAGVWMSSLTGVSAAARVRIVSAGNFALSLEPQAGYRFEYVVPDEALSGAGSRIIAHSVAAALLAEAAIGDHFRAATGAQISLPFAGSFSGQHGEVPFGEGQRGVLPYLVARVAYRMPWGARGFWRLQLQFAVGIGIPGAVPLEFGAGVAAGLDR